MTAPRRRPTSRGRASQEPRGQAWPPSERPVRSRHFGCVPAGRPAVRAEVRLSHTLPGSMDGAHVPSIGSRSCPTYR
ncbi:hypothetical protein CU044_5074 [Streptomyces sp. L-9-10]|nr:hypothetical protein CU044_5074 [Streptomyces sp. L-9-10]